MNTLQILDCEVRDGQHVWVTMSINRQLPYYLYRVYYLGVNIWRLRRPARGGVAALVSILPDAVADIRPATDEEVFLAKLKGITFES
jgi:hypothetical protein